jgi:hypothetical protein
MPSTEKRLFCFVFSASNFPLAGNLAWIKRIWYKIRIPILAWNIMVKVKLSLYRPVEALRVARS